MSTTLFPCCCGQTEETREVTLSFLRTELLYDIQNNSYVEGDVMDAGDDEHRRHPVMDVAEDGNVDRVTRILNLAHAEAVEMLYPYTKEEIPEDQAALDDTLEEPEQYDIVMTLPVSFSLTTVKKLRELIHEYMVCRVMEDWMGITNSGSKEEWAERLEKVRGKIQTTLVSRLNRVRRKLSPF
ncbi:MAG: hypothetical protein Q4E59_00660 [Bacteroidales bacterium]|nr:hypothetical protein [Bacteroidales bacterium]